MSIETEFKAPSATYRMKPFWFWNGDITEKELTHQLTEMKAQGIGGVFISARQGMTVPYLSKRWFDLIRFACLQAKKLGIEAWLYDEYPYPSGMSGGEVLLQHPEAKHMILKHSSYTVAGETPLSLNLGWTEGLFAKAYPIVSGHVDWHAPRDLAADIGNLQVDKLYQESGLTKYTNKRFFSYRSQHILETTLPAGDWQIEVYTQGPHHDFKYYGNYFDPCNADAVATFIKTTHERYKHYVGDLFGDTILGTFADETGYQSPLPWSKELPAWFESRYGYSLLDVLPALYNKAYPHATRIRYEFFQAAAELLRERFHKPIADWCNANGIKYVTEVPSWRMDTQKYSAVVGGDCAHEKLGKPLDTIYNDTIPNYRGNAKMVTSLARQLNKRFAMIESFHSVGWTMTLQDAKWMLDRLGNYGINFNVLHAFYYTVADITKYDAAPSQFLQNPYWPYYHLLADYVARMNVLTTNSEAAIDIAVLDPVASFWTKLGNTPSKFHYRGEDPEEKAALDAAIAQWVGICKTLLTHQINYDHLDAKLFADATVVNGTIKLGRATYQTLVLPAMDCVESTVLTKLQAFVAQGGIVISTGVLPHLSIDGTLSDAETATAWTDLFAADTAYAGIDPNASEFLQLCAQRDTKPFVTKVIAGNAVDLMITQRQTPHTDLIQLVNQGGMPVEIQVQNRANKAMVRLDLTSGEKQPVAMNDHAVTVKLGAFESAWYQTAAVGVIEAPRAAHVTVPMAGDWQVQIKGQNALKLSGWHMQIEDGAAVAVTEKTFIEQCVDTKALPGTALTYQNEFGTPRKLAVQYPLTVTYQTEFEIDNLPHVAKLLKDHDSVAGLQALTINGQQLAPTAWRSERLYDQSNETADVMQYLQLGTNHIMLTVKVKADADGLRAPLYLLGDFGVGEADRVTAMPTTATPDAHFTAGLPYYSGETTFTKALSADTLGGQPDGDAELSLQWRIPHYDVMQVTINGVALGVKAFTPYTWQVPAGMIKATNTISVTLINSMANLFEGEYFDYAQHQTVTIKP